MVQMSIEKIKELNGFVNALFYFTEEILMKYGKMPLEVDVTAHELIKLADKMRKERVENEG